MKHKRIRAYLPDYLDGKELSTSEIVEHLDDKYHYSPSIQQVGNILSGHKEIKKVGFEENYDYQPLPVRTRQCIWTRKE
jgi:hypothetical protein